MIQMVLCRWWSPFRYKKVFVRLVHNAELFCLPWLVSTYSFISLGMSSQYTLSMRLSDMTDPTWIEMIWFLLIGNRSSIPRRRKALGQEAVLNVRQDDKKQSQKSKEQKPCKFATHEGRIWTLMVGGHMILGSGFTPATAVCTFENHRAITSYAMKAQQSILAIKMARIRGGNEDGQFREIYESLCARRSGEGSLKLEPWTTALGHAIEAVGVGARLRPVKEFWTCCSCTEVEVPGSLDVDLREK
nr:hypothetical protein CFP56_77361 [Quercus suber]